jgi:hypothetical protein
MLEDDNDDLMEPHTFQSGLINFVLKKSNGRLAQNELIIKIYLLRSSMSLGNFTRRLQDKTWNFPI